MFQTDITVNGNITFFNGPGAEDALIFYPGAMVEHTSYIDLLTRVAAGGVDCFLMEMPLNIAVMGVNSADSVLQNYSYKHYWIGGHSLGGVAACMYASAHSEKLAGVILLASFTTCDLSASGLRVLSVRGSNDGLLDPGSQESVKPLLPSDATFLTIEGGNHAQFGTYGEQRGDGTAAITGDEQRRQACEAILATISGCKNTQLRD